MSIWGNYTYTDAYFENRTYKNNDIPLVPHHKAGLGLELVLLKDLTFGVIDNYVGRRYFLNDQQNIYSRLNGYMTVDTDLSWAHKDWTVTLGVNNILNKRYSEYAGVRLRDDGLYGYKTVGISSITHRRELM